MAYRERECLFLSSDHICIILFIFMLLRDTWIFFGAMMMLWWMVSWRIMTHKVWIWDDIIAQPWTFTVVITMMIIIAWYPILVYVLGYIFFFRAFFVERHYVRIILCGAAMFWNKIKCCCSHFFVDKNKNDDGGIMDTKKTREKAPPRKIKWARWA